MVEHLVSIQEAMASLPIPGTGEKDTPVITVVRDKSSVILSGTGSLRTSGLHGTLSQRKKRREGKERKIKGQKGWSQVSG